MRGKHFISETIADMIVLVIASFVAAKQIIFVLCWVKHITTTWLMLAVVINDHILGLWSHYTLGVIKKSLKTKYCNISLQWDWICYSKLM